ncbi:MAG: PDZ domain-containing protein [Myxococcales bacterium]|nr:PDZ domain-containing protein [Myxococcales bacterium]
MVAHRPNQWPTARLSHASAGAPSPGAAQIRLFASILLLAVVLAGCKQREQAPRTGATLAAAGDQAYSAEKGQAPAGKPDVAKSDSDEPVDYWKGVRFDAHNFEEVTDYVATYYIDTTVDKKRAWIAAANSALSMMEPSGELLPATFMTARRGHADEEGRMDGNFAAFSCGGKGYKGVVLHRVPGLAYLKHMRKERPDRRLTDKEILDLRAKSKKRYQAYRSAWKPLSFSKAEFECVMGFVKLELAKDAKKRLKSEAETAAKAAKAGKKPAKGDKKAGAKSVAAKKNKAKKKKKKKGPPPALYAKLVDDEGTRRDWTPDINRAWLAASSAYLYALDPHSAVIPRKQWDESTRRTQDSSFEGIGAVLTQRRDRTIVENPMEGLPAWSAGVRAGDQILKVDGVDIRGWLLGKVVKRIRGKKHTVVKLTIAREGEPKPLLIGIKRAHIPIKNVTGKLIPTHPGIGHVKMSGFVPHSAKDLKQKIEELRRKAPGGQLKGLVLDLRRNSGGLLNRAIDIADMFLKRGIVVTVKSRRRMRRGGGPEVHRARAEDSDYKFPVIVLVNDGSASASEIVASAIQENGRGLVAGTRTFGKASVQTLFEPALHLDYYIKLTVARYYAPSGRTIQVTGVHPDITISPKVDGKTHVGFREENLTNHLEPIDPPGKSPMAQMVPALDKCVARSGKAKTIATKEPKPQIQPDYQLLRTADYLTCLARLQAGR